MRGTQPGDEVEVELRGIIPAYAGNTNSVSHTLGTSGDHPRVCGEHRPVSESAQTLLGSSPRMRGTPAAWPARSASKWIIPAYAGNTICRFRSNRDRRDHPRVCGEHCGVCGAYFSCLGSSPRMRGTPGVDGQWRVAPGIIPAYAGNTPTFPWSTTAARDHPRVCGEHVQNALGRFNVAGSSPRMRGTHARNRSGRRNPRIIPAYAGNTCSRRQLRPCRRDHPRVCGEHPSLKPYSASFAGSSPRMRGTHGFHAGLAQVFGIIPAYAGNTPPCPGRAAIHWDHPRVCGEHTLSNRISSGLRGSSPRMRGTPIGCARWRNTNGIIPAYAGNTRTSNHRTCGAWDHPRVCGEHLL